jgi:hypothetical protein
MPTELFYEIKSRPSRLSLSLMVHLKTIILGICSANGAKPHELIGPIDRHCHVMNEESTM